MSNANGAADAPKEGDLRPATAPASNISGAELLDQIVTALKRFVFLSEAQSTAIALWLAHTWVVEAAVISPRLAIGSVEKECGKTTLLDVLLLLARNPLSSANITPAAAARTITGSLVPPTLLIDEADTFLKDKADLIGLLNAGHRYGGAVTKNVSTGGNNWTPTQFPVFCPAAIACIGHLPPTLESRSIKITMHRATRDEKPEWLRKRARGELTDLRQQIEHWAGTARAILADIEPTLPEFLGNRSADNWEPLFAIAQFAGGDWPDRALRATQELEGAGRDARMSDGTRLLFDIRRVLTDEKVEKISSKLLCEKLRAFEESPWARMDRGQGIDQNRLAELLKPYGISPKNVRIGSATLKGYAAKQFDDAFKRYLPPMEAPRDATDE